MLNTRNATYSFEDKYTSFRSALRTIESDIPTYKNALVLGLGLGSIPQLLQGEHHYRNTIDCVEFDAVIIGLAKKYYPTKFDFGKLHIHHADAFDWIMENHQTFDLITMDLFIDKRVPKKFHSIAFLEKLRSAISPNGILLLSRLKENSNIESQLWENIKTVFHSGFDIDTGGNLILCFKNRTA